MNLLFCSVPFRPSVGGIETVSALLAEELHRQGVRVTLVTQSAGGGDAVEPYLVVRRPSSAALWRLVREADVVFHNNVSLRMAWPLALLPRPWVVAHHTWIPTHGVAGRAKRAALRMACNVSVSAAIARHLPVPSARLPNPYQAGLFRLPATGERTRDIAFVGRLVSDKGADLLVLALAILAAHGMRPSVTFIGDGPEAQPLRRQVREAGLQRQVVFAGLRVGQELVAQLHDHRIVVVPSRWEEPFGLVALEALACGCVPVVARSGGLPEAAGPCGRVFDSGNPLALAAELAPLLCDPALRADLLSGATEHLAAHRPDTVAARYLQLFEQVRAGRRVPCPA